MPGFRAAVRHDGAAAGDRPHGAAVDELAASLVSAAQEGVRGAAGPQAFFRGQTQDLPAVLARDRERFFGVDVLPRLQRAQIDLRVGVRRGQVEDDVDFRVAEKRVDGNRLKPELFRRGAGGIRPACSRISRREGAGTHLCCADTRR